MTLVYFWLHPDPLKYMEVHCLIWLLLDPSIHHQIHKDVCFHVRKVRRILLMKLDTSQTCISLKPGARIRTVGWCAAFSMAGLEFDFRVWCQILGSCLLCTKSLWKTWSESKIYGTQLFWFSSWKSSRSKQTSQKAVLFFRNRMFQREISVPFWCDLVWFFNTSFRPF